MNSAARFHLAIAVFAAAWPWSAASGQSPPSADEILAPPLLELNAPLPLSEAPANEATEGFTPSAEFQEWITDLVREHLPHEYEKKQNWGHTRRTFDGVSIQLKNGQLKTHRKYREANDGTWRMYRVKLVDPTEQFEVRVANIRERDDGHVQMEITAVARLDVFGRQAQWERGVQLFSVSAEADARVRLWAAVDVATRLDPTRFPPDVFLSPEVTAAKVEILDFKLRRISDLSGPLVRSLSHSVREALEEKLAEDNAKLVARLNKSIDKQEQKQKLKISAADLLQSQWGKLLAKPEPDANATPASADR